MSYQYRVTLQFNERLRNINSFGSNQMSSQQDSGETEDFYNPETGIFAAVAEGIGLKKISNDLGEIVQAIAESGMAHILTHGLISFPKLRIVSGEGHQLGILNYANPEHLSIAKAVPMPGLFSRR